MLKIASRKTRVTRVADRLTRADALEVLRSTYQVEKGWVAQAESQLPESDLASPLLSWFIAYRGETPAGVLRVHYRPPIATHDHGELNCRSRRITMVLDLKAAYRRLRDGRGWVFRTLTADWDEGLHGRLAA